MARGSAVIPYHGKRGTVWRIKYADADGKQVMETVGSERDGWIEDEGRARPRSEAGRGRAGDAEAEQAHVRRPRHRVRRVALAAKPRKKSTVIDYKATIRNHLSPAFGSLDLGALSRQPEAFEKYAAMKLSAGRSAKSVRNDLVLLGLMFKTARRWRWVSENPLDLVDPPPLGDVETETLAASDVAAVLKAYRELEERAEGEDAYWFAAARRMTTIALSTGMRRGELLGLRWQDVELLDRRLHVRQAFVRNEITTPKSKAGRRVIDIGDVALTALEEQFTSSKHRGPESIVFCHPALGTPLDPSKLTRYARKALDHAGVDESFRPWHGLRHTALTETAAAGVPGMFVQAKAGHAQGSTTERYLHAAKTSYPDAAQLAEARLFAG